MIKLNKLTKAIGTTALLIGASSALAETVTVPASVTVNNAIDFTFTGALNFGEIRGNADTASGACAVLLLPANPAGALVASDDATLCPSATSPGTAVIQPVGGTPTRPSFAIAGIAPFTELNLTVPSTDLELVANLPAGSAKFVVTAFSAYKTSGTPGAITLTSGAGTIQTASDGTASFTVGAKLATDPGTPTTGLYENGIPYEGTFEVTVAY